MKRKLEIQTIRENKNADILDEVLKIDVPLQRQVARKERADYLKKAVVKIKRHEERQEELRLKRIERAQRKLEEELRRKVRARKEEILSDPRRSSGILSDPN